MKPSFYGILEWKPKDIYDNSNKNVLYSVQNTKTVTPDIKNINGQLYVSFNGNYFQDPITIPNNVINIYVAYKLDPISSTRNTDYTTQNASFGAMKITKILILLKIIIKDMVYVLMKVVNLVIQ